MKLAEFITLQGKSLETIADEIGDVSVSGLRKWLAEDRVPRPDQMRRVHVWSGGAVSPNDFVLLGVCRTDHDVASLGHDGENGAAPRAGHANQPTPDLQGSAR